MSLDIISGNMNELAHLNTSVVNVNTNFFYIIER